MTEQSTTGYQPELFPLSAVKTSGYATPEPVETGDRDDTEAEAEAA